MKNDGGPAFPTTEACYENMDRAGEGMSLRDYFAAKAMQAVIARGDDFRVSGSDEIAALAYLMADAMLKDRGAA